MILLENVRLALQSLKLNPLRTVLTLIGIAVGIAAVLYVVVLGEITQRRINDRLESLGSNVLMIRPGFGHRHGVRTATGVVNLKWDDAREIENSSGVINVCVPTYSASAMTEYQDKNWSTRVTGTTPDYETVNNSSPIEGRYFTEAELMERSQVCIIGATVHTELFGDASPVGQSILIRSKRFEVIGLLGAVGESWFNPDDQIFMPLTTAQERLYGADHLSSILAQLNSSDDYEEALLISNISSGATIDCAPTRTMTFGCGGRISSWPPFRTPTRSWPISSSLLLSYRWWWVVSALPTSCSYRWPNECAR